MSFQLCCTLLSWRQGIPAELGHLKHEVDIQMTTGDENEYIGWVYMPSNKPKTCMGQQAAVKPE